MSRDNLGAWEDVYLAGGRRGGLLRHDTAGMLKRLWLCERSVVISQAGWLPGMPDFDLKLTLPRMLWQDSLTGDALMQRVFELRFPARTLDIGDDAALVEALDTLRVAPSALAFLIALSEVVKPAQLSAYEQYLQFADVIADGPSHRFLGLAIAEKRAQIAELIRLAEDYASNCETAERDEAVTFVLDVEQRLRQAGGIFALDSRGHQQRPSPAEGELSAASSPGLSNAGGGWLAQTPARDGRFQNCRFYWPDIVDPTFPYGQGLALQVRSAVSHLNEVWAVETAGYVLASFAGELGWEFVVDAARWTYDESRHCRMGRERLTAWGFRDGELPLGSYIYDSCRAADPLFRVGMLFYFETRNIGKKLTRAKQFHEMQDDTSRHDMDFDWADETIHTSYGKRWLTALLATRGWAGDLAALQQQCERRIEQLVETATSVEKTDIRAIAERLLARAGELAATSGQGQE